jgi:virginiamycin B lyase
MEVRVMRVCVVVAAAVFLVLSAGAAAGERSAVDGVSAPAGVALGANGVLWFTNSGNATIGRLTNDGLLDRFTAPGMRQPWGIARGADRAVWFTDRVANGVGRVTTDGRVTFSTARR